MVVHSVVALWGLVLGLAMGLTGCGWSVDGESHRVRSAIRGGAGFVSAKADLDESRVRLLEAVLTRDKEAIGPLLTPDFSWREDEMPLEETPFDFWDRHRLWEPLSRLLKMKTVRFGAYYVAPEQAKDPAYGGPKVGWRLVGTEWRLAAFHPGSWTDADRELPR
jgi:hypothetical protein